MGWFSMLLLSVIAYVVVMVCVVTWDAFIGFGDDIRFGWSFNDDLPGISLLAGFWPIGLPVVLFTALMHKLEKVKYARIAKEKESKRIRIQIEAEKQQIIDSLAEEIDNLCQPTKKTKRRPKAWAGDRVIEKRRATR